MRVNANKQHKHSSNTAEVVVIGMTGMQMLSVPCIAVSFALISKLLCRHMRWTQRAQEAVSCCCCCCCIVLARSLHEAGCEDAEILEKSMESGSVLVGDVADEIAADLVLVSTEAVHTKQVDANLLAEFVPCPVLLLP